jgi:hypothetical protein
VYNTLRHNSCDVPPNTSKVSPTASKAVNSSVYQLAYSHLKPYLSDKIKSLDFGKDFKTLTSYQKFVSYLQSFKKPKKDDDDDNYNIISNLSTTNKDYCLNLILIAHLSIEQFKELVVNQISIQTKLSPNRFVKFRIGGSLDDVYLIVPTDVELFNKIVEDFCYLVIYTFYIKITKLYFVDYKTVYKKAQDNTKKYKDFVKNNYSKEVIEAYKKEAKQFKKYKQEYEEYNKNIQTWFTKHRRFIRSIGRLNYLKYINFYFGRCTALTATISDDYINDKRAIDNARLQLVRYLKDKGIKYYIVAKELGSENNRIHYHYVLINAPKLNHEEVINSWGIGYVYLQELKNKKIEEELSIEDTPNPNDNVADGAIFYISKYLKKGLNLQFSRSWFKDGILRNDVYYLVEYDKTTNKVKLNDFSKKYFNNKVFVTKNEFRSFFAHYDIEDTKRVINNYNAKMNTYNLYNEEVDFHRQWIEVAQKKANDYLEDNNFAGFDYWNNKVEEHKSLLIPMKQLLFKQEERMSIILCDLIEFKPFIPAPYRFFDITLELKLQKIYKKHCNYRC